MARDSGFFLGPPTPTRCLAGLTTRATRRDRRRYRMVGACLASLAVALGLYGHRLRDSSAEIVARARSIRTQADERTRSLDLETVSNSPNKIKAMEGELLKLQRDEPVTFPPEPKPLFAELGRVLEVAGEHRDSAELLQLSFDDSRDSQLTFQVDDQKKMIELGLAIERLNGAILWERSTRNRNPQQLQMTGRWSP